MKLRGVQLRLTVWYMVLLAVILAVFNAIVYLALQHNLYERATSDVARRATQAAQATSLFGDSIYLDPDKLPEDFGVGSGDFVYVLNAGGKETGQKFPQVRLSAPPPNIAAQGVQGPSGGRVETPQGKVAYSLREIKNPEGVIVGGVLVARPLARTEGILRALTVLLLVASGIALILAFACGQFLAWLSLRPVRQTFQRQRDFVADASHELRTPLALIRANTEALLRRTPGLTPHARRYTNEVLDEVEHLTRIVGDLGSLALADSGQQRLQREPTDLQDLLRGLVRQMEALAAERGVTVRADLTEPAMVEGDPGRLRQLFLILLDNAISYTPGGGTVRLSMWRASQRVEVRLSDTGPGIRAEDLPRVWERFYRVDKARTHDRVTGSGLGLAIAKSIVAAHQGGIRLDSTPGQGTTASVTLPAAPAVSAAQQPVRATSA